MGRGADPLFAYMYVLPNFPLLEDILAKGHALLKGLFSHDSDAHLHQG